MQYSQRKQRELYLCGSECAHVLVDIGISGKKMEQGLNSLDLTGRDIDGILITHEHSDHIKGLGSDRQKIRHSYLCYRRNRRRHASVRLPWKNTGGDFPGNPGGSGI